MEERTRTGSYTRTLMVALLSLGLVSFTIACGGNGNGDDDDNGTEDTGVMEDTGEEDDTTEEMDTSEEMDTQEGDDTMSEDSGMDNGDADTGPAPTARVQIVHAAPEGAVDPVDIWETNSGERLVDDLPYKDATGFIDVPAGTTLNVGVAPQDSSSEEDVIVSQDVEFTEDATNVVVASGIAASPGDWENGNDRGFALSAGEAMESGMAGTVQANIFHGSTDAPSPVDVKEDTSGATLIDDLDFQAFTGITSQLPTSETTVEITSGDGSASAGKFDLPLGMFEGDYLTVVAAGILTPDGDPVEQSTFELLAVEADGTVTAIPPNSSN